MNPIPVNATSVEFANSSARYALTDNVERLELSGSAAISGAGNALDNVILGFTGRPMRQLGRPQHDALDAFSNTKQD